MNKNRSFSSSLGDQLRIHRKSSKLTQADLASRIGCSLYPSLEKSVSTAILADKRRFLYEAESNEAGALVS